jgi:hypothetical protein
MTSFANIIAQTRALAIEPFAKVENLSLRLKLGFGSSSAYFKTGQPFWSFSQKVLLC